MTDIRTDWIDDIGEKVDAAYLNGLAVAVNDNTHARPVTGAFSAMPAAGIVGRMYYATDAGLVFRDNGSSWDTVGGNGTPYLGVPSADWSTTTLDTATVAADKGTRLMTVPPVATTIPRIEYRTLSATSNYTATVNIEPSIMNTAGSVLQGIFVRNSATGAAIFWGTGSNSFGNFLHLDLCSSTAVTSTYSYFNLATVLSGTPKWYRIRDNNVNRYYEFSCNGLDWIPYYNHARATGTTPDQVGWGGVNQSNGSTIYIRLRGFSVT